MGHSAVPEKPETAPMDTSNTYKDLQTLLRLLVLLPQTAWSAQAHCSQPKAGPTGER